MEEGPSHVRNAAATVTGRATGGTRPCRLAGCRGLQLAIRWPDALYPVTPDTWQIGRGIEPPPVQAECDERRSHP